MSNTITNILTINGTEEEVAKVRNYVKGSNGESISFQSFIPMPKRLKGNRKVVVKDCPVPEGMDPITVPDWEYWRIQNWGTVCDAMTIHDEDVEAPNRIIFLTASDTPLAAITTLSQKFPEITFNVIFSDDYVELYCGEYTITGGKVTNKVWYDAIAKIGDLSEDQQMEYYFLTHEYDRNEWKKNEEGRWYNINEMEEE